MKNEVVAMYDRKLRLTRYLTWAFLALCTAIIVIAVLQFLHTSDVKTLIALAALVVLMHEGTVLVKLWYWQQNTKFSLLGEMAELRLQIARLQERQEKA